MTVSIERSTKLEGERLGAGIEVRWAVEVRASRQEDRFRVLIKESDDFWGFGIGLSSAST
jgi:hypothetical protein